MRVASSPRRDTIQRLIQNPLALQILEGKFQEGDHILVREGGQGGAFAFDKAGTTSEVPAPEPAGV